MKSLVVYYSLSGATRFAAEKIAAALHSDILELVPVKNYPAKGFAKYFVGGRSAVMAEKPELQPYTCNADEYDVIILATPLWASRCAPPFNTFLAEHDISSKKIALVVTCDGGPADILFKNTAKTLPNIVATLRLVKPAAHTAEAEDQIAGFAAQLSN